jgi:hypothetical protein
VDLAALHHLISDRINMPVDVPVHVSRRVHALLGGKEPIFVDADVTLGDKTVSGVVVLFTETTVVCATMKDTPKKDPDPASYTVQASAWSRRALLGLDIEADIDDSNSNPDHRWREDYEDMWPHDAVVDLTYKSAPKLRLPLGDSPTTEVRTELRGFIAKLLDDMA